MTPVDHDSVDPDSIAGPSHSPGVSSKASKALRFGLFATFVSFVIVSIRYEAPPRFDETGYLILARSLAEGHGYREIDRPGAPLHAHFPPGWPVLLSTFWTFADRSNESRTIVAHALVAGLWLLAIFFWNRWYAKNLPRRFVVPLTIALIADWLWIRLAGELRSESLFVVLSPIVLLLLPSPGSICGWRRVFAIGLFSGFAILTRHVGVALAAAVGIEFLLRRKPGRLIVAGLATALTLAPWLVMQVVAGHGSQAELLADGEGRYASMASRVGSQLLFYVRRLPDSLFGPFVETATVFRNDRTMAAAATIAALAFAAVWGVGAIRMLRHDRLRPAALYLICSLVILVLWPFTEAGRFLIPLVPLNLAAIALGFETVGNRLSGRFARIPFLAAISGRFGAHAPVAVALAALPFGLYTGLKPWRTGESLVDSRFESACRWIDGNLPGDAVIAARHPGDVFWRTGRKAVPWPKAASAEAAARELHESGAGYVLADLGRYVGEQLPGWLEPLTDAGASEEPAKRDRPRFRQVAEPEAGMRVYEVSGGGAGRR